MATPPKDETKASDLAQTLQQLAENSGPTASAVNGLADALRQLTALCDRGRDQLKAYHGRSEDNSSAPSDRLWNSIEALLKASDSSIQRLHGIVDERTSQVDNAKADQPGLNLSKAEISGLIQAAQLLGSDLDMSMFAVNLEGAKSVPSSARPDLMTKINAVQRSVDEQASQPDPLGILQLTEEAVSASLQTANGIIPPLSVSPPRHLHPDSLSRTMSGESRGSQPGPGAYERRMSRGSQTSATTAGHQQVTDWIRDLENLRLTALTPQTSSGESQMPSIFSTSTEDRDTIATEPAPASGSLAIFDAVEISDDGSDEGFAVDVAKEALESGQEAFDRGDWAEADIMLQEALRLAQDLPTKYRAIYDTYDLQYKLAVCAYYTKEPEAAQIALLSFTKLVPSSDTHRMKLCDVGHLLAQTYTRTSRFDQARSTCESTLKGRRALLGKHHQAFYESLALLARICELQDRLSQAKVYVRMIPMELQRTLCSKFSNLGQLPPATSFEGLRRGLDSDAGSERDNESVAPMSPPRVMSPALSGLSSPSMSPPSMSPNLPEKKGFDGQGHYELAAEQRFSPSITPSATHPAFRGASQAPQMAPQHMPSYSLFPTIQPQHQPQHQPQRQQQPQMQSQHQQFQSGLSQYQVNQSPNAGYPSPPRPDTRSGRPASPTPSTLSGRAQYHSRSASTPSYQPSPLQGYQLPSPVPMPHHAQSFSYPPQSHHMQSIAGVSRSGQVPGAPWPIDVDTRKKWLDRLDILFSGDLEGFIVPETQGKKSSAPTSVHLAALFGDVERATGFLNNGGSLTSICKIPIDKARSVDVVNPLHFAIGARQNAMIKTLVEKGARLEVDRNSKNPAPAAYLLWNAWLDATDYGGIDEAISTLNILLSLGWNINQPLYHTGWTMLHFAAYLPQNKLVLRDAACRFLMGTGADVNALSTNGRTPLHIAANNNGTPETVCMLLSRDASMVNHPDKSGDTALHGAARYRALNPSRVSIDVINALCKAGANVSAKNKDGRSPLEVAEFYKDDEAVSLLRQHYKGGDEAAQMRNTSISSGGSGPHRRLSSFASKFRV